MNLRTFLEALPHLVPLMGQAMAVKTLVEQIVASFHTPADQDTARAAIAALAPGNDTGHAEYQALLKEAEGR